MGEVILTAKGINGQIDLFQNILRIRRKGALSFISQGLKGEKEIQISQISAVQIKKPGVWTNGYIQFSFLGGQENKKGLFSATQDENTIIFNPRQQRDFIALKEKLDQIIASGSSDSKESSGLDDLEKLASLRDKGIITKEEFTLKKKQILGL